MENGYHIYDFKGEALREEPIDKFKQFQWRPRPATLLTKEEQKQIRKNLREYSRVFEQEDADRGASADLAVVEARRRMLEEWHAWRAEVEEDLAEERAALGLPACGAARGEDEGDGGLGSGCRAGPGHRGDCGGRVGRERGGARVEAGGFQRLCMVTLLGAAFGCTGKKIKSVRSGAPGLRNDISTRWRGCSCV